MADKSLKELRLLEITKRLQCIADELTIEINAPKRVKKPSKAQMDRAEAIANIERWTRNLNRKNSLR